MPVTPALRRQRQGDCCECEVGLGSTESSFLKQNTCQGGIQRREIGRRKRREVGRASERTRQDTKK